MRTRLTIETDQPCIVLIIPIPLPQRVERNRAPRRVIVTSGVERRDSELPPSGAAASVRPFVRELRRVG